MKDKNYTTANLKRAKQMIKDYLGAKFRVELYPHKRPTFMKQMKIDLSDYESSGVVHYDTNLASRLDIDDWFFLSQYINDMEAIWFVDHGIDIQRNEVTKLIGDKVIREGKDNLEMEKLCGLQKRSIRWHKEKIAKDIASILPW